MKSGWEAGINAHESRYFGWWGGSSGSESDGSGSGDARESRDFGWLSGGSGDGDSIFFRGTVFVCDGGGVFEGTFWVGGT